MFARLRARIGLIRDAFSPGKRRESFETVIGRINPTPRTARLAHIVPAGNGTTQAAASQTAALAAISQAAAEASLKNADPYHVPTLMGGRQSQPTNYNPFGLSTYNFVWRREYQDIDLADLNIGDYEAGQLLTILADLSPDVSQAVWNIVRMCGVDLTFHVTDLNGKDDPVGQQMVEEAMRTLGRDTGGFGGIITQLLLTAYVQGAVCLDAAPTPNLDGIKDFYAVNPNTIYFVRDENQDPQPFQRQYIWGAGMAPFRRMNTQTFFYAPIDPYVDDVYGRSPMSPILQIIFFQIQLWEDLRRVIHAQGWPKIDIKLVTEILMQHAPADARLDGKKLALWVQDRIREVTTAYNNMAPEDAFIHPDYVELSSENASAGKQLFDVDVLLSAVRGQVMAALKEMPVVAGQHTGSTETYSTIELTIFAHTIQCFRGPVGKCLAWAMALGLRLAGRQALVTETWAPAQIYDRMNMAMAMAQEMANEAFKRDQGWQTQDQASRAITGSDAVGPPLLTEVTPYNGPTGPAQSPANPPTTQNPGKPAALQGKK